MSEELSESNSNSPSLPARRGPLFALGHLLATPGALRALELHAISPSQLIGRHVRGDWGDVCGEDRAANNAALVCGARLFSVYQLGTPADADLGESKLWIITEADRACTTILLPSEY